MANIFDQDPQGPATPAVATSAQPQTPGNGATQAAPAPQARGRGLGCVSGAIRALFIIGVSTVSTVATLGMLGLRIPLIHEVAKTIGYTIVLALTPSSMARLGYAAIAVPVVLIAATWITARASK